MSAVKVWNDNVHPYKELFREKQIHIAPKSFIEMDEHEALLFRGTFAPIQLDGDGNPVAEGFKMIRIEPIEDNKPTKVNPLICNACAYEAASEKDLTEHASAAHSAALMVDVEIDRALAEKKKGAAKK